MTNEVKHTPGPWEVARASHLEDGKRVLSEYFVRYGGDDTSIPNDVAIAADILNPITATCDEVAGANAALIASAPELLAACKRMMLATEEVDSPSSEINQELAASIAVMRAAIARAEGVADDK